MDHLFLDACRMRHVMNNQVPHVSLHNYCTKPQQRLLQPGYLIIDHLYLLQAYVDDVQLQEATRLLDQPMAGHNVDAEVPAYPPRKDQNTGQNKTHEQTDKEKAE